MCFPRHFFSLWIFFLPFFYFPVSILRILLKMTKKKRKFPILRYEIFICVWWTIYLYYYAKELFAFKINLFANNGIVIEGYIGYIYINFMEFFRSYRWLTLMSHLFYIKLFEINLFANDGYIYINFMEFFRSYRWLTLMSHLFYIKF